jgi:hypothetical protein
MYDDGIQIKSVPFFWSPPCYICPTGSDVRFLADTRIKDFAHVEYWETVRLLLLAGFCLLLCCSSSFAEDIFKPTGKYLEVTTGDSEPVTLERTDNPTRFKFSSKMPAKPQRQWYLVSEPWCGSCPVAKARFLSLGWSQENILTIAQCEAKFGFRPDHVPFEFGEPVAMTSSIYNGKAGSSHQNRGTLINHLLTEGIHSGRHTSQALNAMTDGELGSLHEADHGDKPTSQPVRIQQSACPGGNCPAPTNRAQRRGGLLRGWFR